MSVIWKTDVANASKTSGHRSYQMTPMINSMKDDKQ